MKYSPSPVPDTAQDSLLAYVPAPISGVSPTRPLCLLVRPPVEVAAARLPARSSATAPTVPMLLAAPAITAGAVGALGAPRLFELALARLGAEIIARHEHHTLFQRKVLGALGHQQHVRALLHHEACQLYGVLYVPYAGHRPGARPGAVHDGRVELGVTIAVEHRAAPGVELRIVLQQPHCGDHRIEARATALEHVVAGIERGRESAAVGGFGRRGHLRRLDDARTAVDDDRDRCRRGAARSGGHQRDRRDEQHGEKSAEPWARHGFPAAAMIEALTAHARACGAPLHRDGRS